MLPATVVVTSQPTLRYLEFDGSNDFLEIEDNDSLDLDVSAFTISAWIRPAGWGENDQGRILDHGGGSSGGAGWTLSLENRQSQGFPQALRVQINNDGSFDGYSDTGSVGLTINSGDEAEAIGNGQVLETAVRGITLSGRHQLNGRIGLQWWLGIHDQGDFYRRRFFGMAVSVGI